MKDNEILEEIRKQIEAKLIPNFENIKLVFKHEIICVTPDEAGNLIKGTSHASLLPKLYWQVQVDNRCENMKLVELVMQLTVLVDDKVVEAAGKQWENSMQQFIKEQRLAVLMHTYPKQDPHEITVSQIQQLLLQKQNAMQAQMMKNLLDSLGK